MSRHRKMAISGLALSVMITALVGPETFAQEDTSGTSTLKTEATALAPLVKSDLAHKFLQAVPDLPQIRPSRVVYVKKETREYLSESAYSQLKDSARAGFVKRELGEDFYYYTRYGSPLAFVRPLDLVAQAGFTKLDGAKIADFGFGTIGQLRLMASLGASVTGIEVDQLLKILYSADGDTGPIKRSRIAGAGKNGALTTLYGSFPSDTILSREAGNGYDVFFSKNTLKRGYIHPEREADPRMLVHLGVDDSTFVKRVYDLLKPGGFFMIYNLHPAKSAPDQPYIPWSDGRCPFDKALLEKTGFTVLTFDQDDTEFARTMGKALGWDKEMKFETDLFGTYTLLKK